MEQSLLFKHILIKPIKGSGYRYSPYMINLLSKVSGVDEEIIKNTKIDIRSIRKYIPFYSAKKGGGAITLGNHKWQSITFTENFFSTDQKLFNNRAYANDLHSWLRMSSHEVGHLAHTHRYKSFLIYLIVFAYQYMKYGHDDAPLEIEAEEGTSELCRFDNYLRVNGYSKGTHNLILSEKSEQEKITELEELWIEYKRDKEGILASNN